MKRAGCRSNKNNAWRQTPSAVHSLAPNLRSGDLACVPTPHSIPSQPSSPFYTLPKPFLVHVIPPLPSPVLLPAKLLVAKKTHVLLPAVWLIAKKPRPKHDSRFLSLVSIYTQTHYHTFCIKVHPINLRHVDAIQSHISKLVLILRRYQDCHRRQGDNNPNNFNDECN